jgi:hypothetical protein
MSAFHLLQIDILDPGNVTTIHNMTSSNKTIDELVARYVYEAHVMATLVCGLVLVLIMGSFISLVVLCLTRRHNRCTTWMFFDLTLVYVCMALFSVPFLPYRYFAPIWSNVARLQDDEVCLMLVFADSFFRVASALVLVMINVDRLLFINVPTRLHTTLRYRIPLLVGSVVNYLMLPGAVLLIIYPPPELDVTCTHTWIANSSSSNDSSSDYML